MSDKRNSLFQESTESQWNHFPSWCIRDPVVDSTMVSDIKNTWSMLKTGQCQGYQRFKKTGQLALMGISAHGSKTGSKATKMNKTKGGTTASLKTTETHTAKASKTASIASNASISEMHSREGTECNGPLEIEIANQSYADNVDWTDDLHKEMFEIVAKEGLSLKVHEPAKKGVEKEKPVEHYQAHPHGPHHHAAHAAHHAPHAANQVVEHHQAHHAQTAHGHAQTAHGAAHKKAGIAVSSARTSWPVSTVKLHKITPSGTPTMATRTLQQQQQAATAKEDGSPSPLPGNRNFTGSAKEDGSPSPLPGKRNSTGSAKEDGSPSPLPGKRNSTGSVPTQLTGTPTMATRALAKLAGKRNSTGSSRVAQLKGARSVGNSPKGSPLLINRRIQQALGLKGTRTSSTQPRGHQWQWNPAGTAALCGGCGKGNNDPTLVQPCPYGVVVSDSCELLDQPGGVMSLAKSESVPQRECEGAALAGGVVRDNTADEDDFHLVIDDNLHQAGNEEQVPPPPLETVPKDENAAAAAGTTDETDEAAEQEEEVEEAPAKSKATRWRGLGEDDKDEIDTKNISPAQFFYDNFYMHLFALSPSYRLMFTDNIARQGKMLAQLVGFIVHNADQLHTHEFQKTAYNLARVHNKRGIRAEDYDTLGQALLMAIKASLGNDYSERIKVAWTTVFSSLLIAVLPYVDQTRTIYIRLAKWNPELCADPVVRQAVKSSKPEKKAAEKGCAIM